MRVTTIILAGSVLPSVVLATAPADARHRHGAGYRYDRYERVYGLNPSVGRNAPEAIGNGLAGMTENWFDTMGNAFARPSLEYRLDPRRRSY